MNCQSCGAVAPEGSTFCIECGARLPMPIYNVIEPPDSSLFCTVCGSGVRMGEAVCLSCGARIGVPMGHGTRRERLVRSAFIGGALLLLLLAIGGQAGYRAWRQKRDLKAHYAWGSSALQAGDLVAALQELGWVAERDPNFEDVQKLLQTAQDQADSAALYAQAQAYCDRQRWRMGIDALESLQARSPLYQPQVVRGLLFTAYREEGLGLARDGQFDQAVQRFDQALALTPDPEVEKQKLLATRYALGLAALDRKQYDTAIMVLEEVQAIEPAYADLSHKLYAAYFAGCRELRDAGDLDAAEARCLSAYRLRPKEGGAAAQLTQVAFLRTPTATPTLTPSPTPTITPSPTPTNTPRPRVCRNPAIGSIAYKRQDRCDPVGGAGCGTVEYWVMNADGTNQKPICNRGDYDWALNRDRTSNDDAWRLETYGRQNDIYQIWSGTAQRTLIISDWAKDWDPVLSADNWWLAWVTNRNGNDEIYVKTMNPADQHQRRLTVNQWEWDKHPTWSPDGRQIAFYSNRANTLNEATRQIWIMDVVNDQGANLRNLSNNPGEVDTDPIWIKWEIP